MKSPSSRADHSHTVSFTIPESWSDGQIIDFSNMLDLLSHGVWNCYQLRLDYAHGHRHRSANASLDHPPDAPPQTDWFRAHLRWAVMVPGKQGLRSWEESMLIFLSKDHHSATAHALRFGREHERAWGEWGKRRQNVQRRLAEIVSLDLLGSNQTEFEVCLGAKKPSVKLPFEHLFDPERVPPPASF